MKFSIIVPVFNVEQYLQECLESILGQSYQDFEVICVDDASVDKSYEILMSYAENNSKIKVFHNNCNRGVSASRNRGMNEAKGDYILFVDSDDMLKKNALEILNNSILLCNTVDTVHYNYNIKNESRVEKERNTPPKENIEFNENVQTGQSLFMEMAQKKYFFSALHGNLYKREFLNNNGFRFFEGIVYEDVLFTFDCMLAASTSIFINENLYTYRKRDHSITTTTTKLHLDSLIVVIGEIMGRWRSYKLEEGMDDAITQYIDRYIPRINKLCALFPDHNRLDVGTQADQFLFEIFNGAKRKQFLYVRLEDSDLQLIRRYEKVIVFGAGGVALELISCLKDYKIEIEAVAVSDKTINMDEILGVHVYQVEEMLHLRKNALVIISIIKRNQQPIVQRLQEMGFENIFCIDTDKAGK